MNTKFRRVISFVMAIVLVMSLTPMNVLAITESDGQKLTAAAADVTVSKSSESQVVNVVHYILEDAEIASIGVSVAINDPDNVGATFVGGATNAVDSISGGINIPASGTAGGIASFDQDAGHHMPYIDSLKGYVITTIPVEIPANAVGTFTVVFSNFAHADFNDGMGYEFNNQTATATITVKEPSAPYEIYYTLDQTDDGDTDKYAEYDIETDESVTVYVKLKNNSAATILQAYDVYLTYNENLTNPVVTGSYVVGHNSDADATDGVKELHMQAISEDTDNPIRIALAEDAEVLLGTITFKIDSENVAYNDLLAITLIDAADEENSTHAAKVTNFSVGSDATGDKKSYYPANTSALNGIEPATYTVTYDAGEGSWGENVEDPTQTKEYNVDLDLIDDVPTAPEGKVFDGWADAEGTKYTSYTGNADITLIAQWKTAAHTVTWYGTDGNEIYHVSVNDDTTTSFDKVNYEEPSKDADAQYTYSFKGWTTDDTPDLDAEVIDLATYKITEATDFYPVFSTTTNTYTVTWKDWDGEVLREDKNVAYGETPSYGSDPTRASDAQYDYTFDKWTPAIEDVTGNVTYTATYTSTVRSYTVTYAAGTNGSLTGDTTETVQYGSNPASVPTPVADAGYKFTGWYDTTNGEKVTDISTYEVQGAVTLTAQFEKETYSITFDVNGGDAVANIPSYTITDTVTLPKPTKTGATFDGWKLGSTVGNWEAKTYSAGDYTGKYGTITLVAQWSDNAYTISQGATTGGTVTPSKNSANYKDVITLSYQADDGYTFVEYIVTYKVMEDGQEVTKTVPVIDGQFEMPEYNVTVSATFNPIPYDLTVTNPADGTGTVSADKGTATVGQTVTLSSVPKAGYQLVSYIVTYNVMENGQEVTKTVTVTDGKFEMPAADVNVTATFEGIGYTIVFDKNADDATGTVNNLPATFGQKVTLTGGKYTRPGYNFLGWSLDQNADEATYAADAIIADAFFTPTADSKQVKLYAVWSAIPYDVTVTSPAEGEVSADKEEATIGQTVTLDNTPDAGYELEKYIVKDANNADVPVTESNGVYTFTMPASNVTVTATFTKILFDVEVSNPADSNGTVDANMDEATVGATVTLSNEPDPGYKLVDYTVKDAEGNVVPVDEDGTFTMPASKVTVTAEFELIPYTITLDPAGGTVNPTTINYNVEQSVTLPTPAKALYTFTGWKVTTPDGSWQLNSEITPNNLTVAAGAYGTVTLTAQWEEDTTMVQVEQYKYAFTGYWMLRVDASDVEDGYEYQFAGKSMYYTTDSNYLVASGDDGVFYLLIPTTGENDVKYVENGELTAEGYKKLTTAPCDARATIDYTNRDINGDGVVNIADANVVYQMVVNGGAYYSDGEKANGQLNIEQRLRADFHKDTAEFRGSIADVNVVVNQINGVTATN